MIIPVSASGKTLPYEGFEVNSPYVPAMEGGGVPGMWHFDSTGGEREGFLTCFKWFPAGWQTIRYVTVREGDFLARCDEFDDLIDVYRVEGVARVAEGRAALRQ